MGKTYLSSLLEPEDVNGLVFEDGTIMGGAGAPDFIPQAAKTLYVDGSRSDSYTPTGCVVKPFRTITDAVNQIIANGDNASNLYRIDIATGTYQETLVLEDLNLINLVFDGHHAATVLSIRSIANNSNLVKLVFKDLLIGFGGGASSVSLIGGANFLSQGSDFFDCDVSVDSWIQTAPGTQTNLYGTNFSCTTAALTNIPFGFNFWGQRGPTTGVTFNLINASLGIQRGSRNGGAVNIDATSVLNVVHARQDGNVVVNGTFTNRLGLVTGNITINSGGLYREYGGHHSGTLIKNAGGNYVQLGTVGVAAVMVNGANVSAGTGSPNGAVLGSPGDQYLNLAGGAGSTLWIKESGVATNTGWAAK